MQQMNINMYWHNIDRIYNNLKNIVDIFKLKKMNDIFI